MLAYEHRNRYTSYLGKVDQFSNFASVKITLVFVLNLEPVCTLCLCKVKHRVDRQAIWCMIHINLEPIWIVILHRAPDNK